MDCISNAEIIKELQMIVKVLIASVLTGFVGWEREREAKPAGLRTNIIVGASAALLVMLGTLMIANFQQGNNNGIMRTDPLRIIEAIIVGVSFIGAGTILKSESATKVHYLTSAATLLFSATIGISVALDKYITAVMLVIIILLINYLVRKIEQKYVSKNDHFDKDNLKK